MTDISTPPPPRRPNKSRLRTLPSVDQISTSSIHSVSPSQSPILQHDERHHSIGSDDSYRFANSPVPSIDSVLLKNKYKSRFKEHFDPRKKHSIDSGSSSDTSSINEIPFPPSTKPQRPDILKTSHSMTTFSSATSAPYKYKSYNRSASSANNSGDELNLPLDHMMTTSTKTTTKRVQLTSSVSTPLQIPTEMKPRRFGSSGSVLTTSNSTSSTSNNKLSNIIPALNLNRANVIITRLESWSSFLKSIIHWMEEVSKINITSSRHYYQRAYPHLEESSAVSTTTTTTTQNASTTQLVQQNVNSAILTVQAGFQVLTTQIAAEQGEFAKTLHREYLPALIKLRKECKEKIHKLKHDPALAMDELLRRAEVTRSKMTHLNRCCKQADKTQGQVEMDPWVANLLVLRQLKREVDEENRLRLLMLPIQKEAEEFETRLINQVKPTIRYCYERLAPGALDGTDDKDTAPFQLLLDQVMPKYEWSQFVELQKKDLVNEKNPTKDYLKINYPNKFHPLVMTLCKGKLERKFGVRKQFTERNYVLSQGGYLHQFSLDDKVSPEKTIYIPSCTIVPSIDIQHLSNMSQKALLESTTLDTSNTFEICRPASNVLQRDKVSIFRASNREELITWCRLLLHIASGVSLSSVGITEHDLFLRNGSNSFDELENHPDSQFSQFSDSSKQKSIATATATDSATPLSSPARSLRSVRTEESFNEPAAMNKRRSNRPPKVSTQHTTEADLKTPTTAIIPEEYLNIVEDDTYNNTDAESFVTARFADNEVEGSNSNNDEDEVHSEVVDDYFSILGTQKHEDKQVEDDAVSIASTSTAKGPTSSIKKEKSSEEMASSSTDSPQNKRSPSLASTNFDDAQSSLYFSSGSAPPSPSSSTHSSIVSIPDFQLVPEVTSRTLTEEEVKENRRLTAAETYKANLSFKLDDE